MSAEVYQRVYTYHRDYAALHGYAPTSGEACHWMHISSRTYYAALRWLAERRFLSLQARRWRGVRLNVRVCTCGAEITPQNAVFVQGKRRVYVRKHCASCYSAAQIVRARAWDARNPGYQARLKRRERQRQKGVSA